MHPVLELINQRAEEGSQPGQRTDGRRLGLVVEGGGMRGVVSGGMLAALEHLGLALVFDAVYGSSAGAINGAYFVARGHGAGVSIYYQEINNRRFIDPLRALVGRPIMSLDYLLDEVMTHIKPLDWRAVIDSPVRLKIVATALARGETVILDEYNSQRQLFDRLRASATMPFLAGEPVKLEGELSIDAAVYESIPFRIALADGCSDVLVLLTRPAGVRRAGP
ncbi:MAG: patatin-like phospholipase family protein, partial [Deltaproteobacteria bacterium]|nr:patatin-like phospholipase family protein [Deltaproteobacteria bacterium]